MTSPRSILITGAARGIGRATAELFLSRGWRVGMYDVDAATVAEAAGGRPLAVAGQLDVRDAEAWGRTLETFCANGRLDVLVNNAGVLASGPFTGTDWHTHRRLVEVNVLGTTYGALFAHPYLQRSGGLLLNLCSASALYGQPTLATYAATKAAVKSLTEALELEWRGDGVRVRSLMPLFVATDMVARDGQGARSLRLGVRLTAEDVASAAWRVVHEGPQRLRSPHRAVGLQTRVLAAANAVSPGWASRLMAARIAQ